MHRVSVQQKNILHRLAVPFLGLLLAAPVLNADPNRNLAVAKTTPRPPSSASRWSSATAPTAPRRSPTR